MNTNQLTQWLQMTTGLSPELQGKMLISILAILIIFLLRRFILGIVFQRVEDVLEEFARCPDIDFAYPTQRFYNNFLEGKPDTPLSSSPPNRSEEARCPGTI